MTYIPYSYRVYSGDGSKVTFDVPFPYIKQAHVEVTRIDKATQAETKLTYLATGVPTGDEYIWKDDNEITVGTAPTTDESLRVQRDTPEDQQIVQWVDGSYIVSFDLNQSDTQWLYGLQELDDKFSKLSTTAIKYFGAIDLTVDKPPASPDGGTFYINTGDGVVLADWTGIAGDAVVGSEQVIYNDATSVWQIFKVPSTQAGVLLVNATAPITVDNTDPQKPIVGFSDAPSDTEQYVRQSSVVGGPLAWAQVAIPPGTIVADPLPVDPVPEIGQLGYNTGDGRLYIWNGAWVDASPAANPGVTQITAGDNITIDPVGGTGNVTIDWSGVIVADAAPDPNTTPENSLYWSSKQGKLYINYKDTDGNQWVETSPDGGGGGNSLWSLSGNELSPATANNSVALTSDGTTPAFTVVSPLAARMSIGQNKDGEGVAGGTHLGLYSFDGGSEIFTSGGDLRIAVDGAQAFTSSITIGPGLGNDYWLQFASTGNATFSDSVTVTGNVNAASVRAGYFVAAPTTDQAGLLNEQNASNYPFAYVQKDNGDLGVGNDLTLTFGWDGTITSRNIVTSNRLTNTDFCFVAQNAGTNNAVIRADGTYFGQNNVIQPINSERRLKENIAAIDSETAWETIKNTPYYAYNFIGSESTVYGPMADEVPAEMVVQPMEENEEGVMVARSDDQGPIRSYDNGMLQARLYTALQTALTRIEALEAQLSALQEAN